MTELLQHGAGHYFTSHFFNARPINNNFGPFPTNPSTGTDEPPILTSLGSPGHNPTGSKPSVSLDKPSEPLSPPESTKIAEYASGFVAALALGLGLYVSSLPGGQVGGFPKSYIYALLGLFSAGAITAFVLLYRGDIMGYHAPTDYYSTDNYCGMTKPVKCDGDVCCGANDICQKGVNCWSK